MISARRTRLVRARDLHVYRRVIVALAEGAESAPLIVVPTQAAAAVLAGIDGGAGQRWRAVTRDQLYASLHAGVPTPLPWLSAVERDALMQAAAAAAQAAITDLPFQVRPGLVGEMLRFYDQLRRQTQSVRRFNELLTQAIGGGGDLADRGAERLLRQTAFLVTAFDDYERRVAASGRCDEHLLRAQLLADPGPAVVRQIIVTVPDWIADPAGLFVADFELLARLPGLEQIDLVSTTALLGSGFHQRLHEWWPGLDEIDADAVIGAQPVVRPVLVRPADLDDEHLWATHRDRHEELASVAQRLGSDAAAAKAAVVFKHPLPYLYLAPEIFGPAGLAYRVHDALPLAAEPAIAPLDLLLDAVESDFARDALVAALASPFLRVAGHTFDRASLSALNGALSEARYLGGVERLQRLAGSLRSDEAAPALGAAVALAVALAPLAEPSPASLKLRQCASLISAHFPLDAEPALTASERRVRQDMLDLLEHLAEAHARHHDPTWALDDLAGSLRRWIGERLSAAPLGGEGVSLLDDQAARYGEFDDVTIVGLIEPNWPERPRRNIFYPPNLLKSLGWPSERDRRGADDARFLDLIASATRRVELSTFSLDDETLVSRTVQLDEVPRARLSSVTAEPSFAAPVPPGQSDASGTQPAVAGRTADPGAATGGSPGAAWLAVRHVQPDPSAPEFHGAIGGWRARSYSVSALETYLGCPFKFFAQHVLELDEEPDDEEVMDPRRQGQFVHRVFEVFFREWQDTGQRAITPALLAAARQLFATVVERLLTDLPEGERALERSRLLGTSAASGLGEAVFRMEAERPEPVIERLLEHSLSGSYELSAGERRRRVALRGKADRIDLLADGTFRLIDYKLGWPPDRNKALQLPIYGACAEQQLAGRHQRTWTLGEAVYLAFKGPKRVVPLFTTREQRDEVIARAQQRVLDAIEAIERGEFPPSPDDVYRCDTCSFSAVCRRDYVGAV